VGDPDKGPVQVGAVEHHRRPRHQQRLQPVGPGGAAQHGIEPGSLPGLTGPALKVARRRAS
jgi:hypothetical protein